MKNAFYAQSGGVTSVINASACGLIETARQHQIKVYAGLNGIVGALQEQLIDTSKEPIENIAALRYSPGGAFGSARYKLKSIEDNRAEYERLLEVFLAHNIQYFFYNGGGDSQDTAWKMSEFCQQQGHPIQCIGIPKTIDNDLPITDNCPGFGSVAKYVAISTREAGLDVASMAATSTKVFILEVMGRHTGWIAAAAGLASEREGQPPHLILLPEIPFDQKRFLQKVDQCVKKYGYCVVVVSEGVKNAEGVFLSGAGTKDAFGHTQLGGVAPTIARLIQSELKYKYHWAVSDYLQRAARHIASKTDVEQAYALGKAALEFALRGIDAIMTTIVRESSSPYRWHIDKTALSAVANVEKPLPSEYIREDGFGITQLARQYLSPLIQGEDHPLYQNGLPCYVELENHLVPKKCREFTL